jgi:hypothetical protein
MMTYYKTVINPSSMSADGVATIDDARDYASWLQERLERDYPDADIQIRASETEAEVTQTDGNDDDRPIQSIINEWSEEWLVQRA